MIIPKRNVLIIAFCLIFLGLSCIAYLLSLNEPALSRKVQLTQFAICDNFNSLTDNIDKLAHCGNVFSIGTRELYACGYIDFPDSDNSKVAVLSIYLYKEQIIKPVYSNPVGDKFSEGHFCRKILLPNENQQGYYQVKVYLFRDIIASSEFSIQ